MDGCDVMAAEFAASPQRPGRRASLNTRLNAGVARAGGVWGPQLATRCAWLGQWRGRQAAVRRLHHFQAQQFGRRRQQLGHCKGGISSLQGRRGRRRKPFDGHLVALLQVALRDDESLLQPRHGAQVMAQHQRRSAGPQAQGGAGQGQAGTRGEQGEFAPLGRAVSGHLGQDRLHLGLGVGRDGVLPRAPDPVGRQGREPGRGPMGHAGDVALRVQHQGQVAARPTKACARLGAKAANGPRSGKGAKVPGAVLAMAQTLRTWRASARR